MNSNVDYIIDLGDKTKIVSIEKSIKAKEKYTKIIDKECFLYMTTIDGRIKAMSKYWGSNYNVPIYVNDDLCFLKVDKYVWINVCNVEKIVEKNIIFLSGMTLHFEISKRNLKEKIVRLKDIIKNVKK